MKIIRGGFVVFGLVGIFLAFASAAKAASASEVTSGITTAPVYVPDLKHQNDPLPDGVLAWDALLKATDTTNGQDFARFVFNFTNVFQMLTTVTETNVVTLTNIVSVTNKTFFHKKITLVEEYTLVTNVLSGEHRAPSPVTILAVHPSCGCTTAELPPTPWTIPPGGEGQIKLSVNLAGKAGTVFKTVNIATDQGKKDLMLRITLAPPLPPRVLAESERVAAMNQARGDRQAVFKGDCASCHAPKSSSIYGQELYKAVCAICHESEHRASVVPDLAKLKAPTNEDFWRTWIIGGKPSSLMPAFAQSQGGPLTDIQIASLATYLNTQFPSHATNTFGQ